MADRPLVYAGSIPLDTDLLSTNRNAMVGLGYLAQAVLGASPVAAGLACTLSNPASLTVTIGPGSLTQPGVIDPNAYGSLNADSSPLAPLYAADGVSPLLKTGINTTPTAFTLAAPTVAGQSIAYLIEAAYTEADAIPFVLPYVNAANPSQPFSGPDNAGTAQNLVRIQRVNLRVSPGAPAAAGTQAAPAPDGGFQPLYVVTVAYGQTALSAGNVVQHPQAPFPPFVLPQLTPGFRNRVRLPGTAGMWPLPLGITAFRVSLQGGGGGGGSCIVSSSSNIASQDAGGSGGGGGGWSTKLFTGQTPGTMFPFVVGAGGGPQQPGGTTSWGSAFSATGGNGGLFQATGSSAGAAPGVGVGGDINDSGGVGADGQSGSFIFTGNGGGSHYGSGGRAGNHGGIGGGAPGTGGGGAYDSTFTNTQYNGGAGASGIVEVEF